MSRFSEEERERIRSQLVEEGRRLFAQYGFERTRIRDITDAVGIGTSTFYQFFDSKEALYAEVLCVERDSLERNVAAAIAEAESTREEVRVMFEETFREVRTNPLISRLVIENELRVLQEELTDAERESLAADVQTEPADYVERWTDDPEFRYDDPEVVDGLVHSLVFTTGAQEIFSETVQEVDYDVIERELIEVVVDGLFTQSTGSDQN